MANIINSIISFIESKLFPQKELDYKEVTEYFKDILVELIPENWVYAVVDQDHPEYNEVMSALDKERRDTIVYALEGWKDILSEKRFTQLVDFFMKHHCGFHKTGVTNPSEFCGQDIILLFTDSFQYTWRKFHPTDWKEAARTVVRHEIRHAEQFMELRKRGEDAVYKAMALYAAMGYDECPMEVDAYSNQGKDRKHQTSIVAAVDSIVAAYN